MRLQRLSKLSLLRRGLAKIWKPFSSELHVKEEGKLSNDPPPM